MAQAVGAGPMHGWASSARLSIKPKNHREKKRNDDDERRPEGYRNTAIDPVVNHVGADSETLSHLLNSQFPRPYERGPGNLVAVTNPLDHRTSEGFAQGADLPSLI